MENYYRYLGEGSRERIQNRSTASGVPVRVVALTGADEPFYLLHRDPLRRLRPRGLQRLGRRGARRHDDRLARPVVPHLRRHGRQVRPDPAQAGGRHRGRRGLHGGLGRRRRRPRRSPPRRPRTRPGASAISLTVALEALNAADGRIVRRGLPLRPGPHRGRGHEREGDARPRSLELAPGDAGPGGRRRPAGQGRRRRRRRRTLAVLDARRRRPARTPGRQGRASRPDGAREESRPDRAPADGQGPRRAATANTRSSSRPCPAPTGSKFPVAGKDLVLADPGELQLLVDGKHSALDIKKMLDAQHERRSTLQAVLNYLEILKLAGLVEW
ncbi:MAG: hypothetical protein MZW92_10110 [Comamonadaceae bacterium]|nr:hypothetical protein [Comamonadaceae bacterium]